MAWYNELNAPILRTGKLEEQPWRIYLLQTMLEHLKEHFSYSIQEYKKAKQYTLKSRISQRLKV